MVVVLFCVLRWETGSKRGSLTFVVLKQKIDNPSPGHLPVTGLKAEELCETADLKVSGVMV